MKFRKQKISYGAIIVVLLALAALPAHASFPGKNGRIAFIQGPDIFTMNADGSDVRQLTTLTDGSFVYAPEWSADGKQIIFQYHPAPDFIGQIWTVNTDGTNQHRLYTDDPSYGDYHPSFSPDGKQVVFTRCGPVNCAIYRVQSDGTGLTSLTPFNANPDTFDVLPRYAPDGLTIAFASYNRRGVLGAIYLMNPDGSNLRRLTPTGIGATTLDWSPDSTKVAVDTHCCNPQPSTIDITNIDRGEVVEVTHSNRKLADFVPSWSPQADAIVFERHNLDAGTVGIYVTSPDGREKLILEKSESAFHRQSRHGGPGRGMKGPHPRQIEDGGTYPRWGVAQ
jgi:TolB protein